MLEKTKESKETTNGSLQHLPGGVAVVKSITYFHVISEQIRDLSESAGVQIRQ